MYQLDFNRPSHIHFIGIGGISMSGLASILLSRHFTVSGSDSAESGLTRTLAEAGAQICIGQRAENISAGTDAVVYTAAIRPDNPELAAAVSRGIPTLTRAELLGQMMKNYETPVAVAGTHGKTTTTSMTAHILMAADMDPTISVGGMLPLIGGNIRVGGTKTFLAEACEYTNSFLSFFPKVSIILNVDADHLDFFKDLDDIRASFRRFAELLPADGTLVINADDPSCPAICEGLACRVVTCALDREADYTAAGITFSPEGFASFDMLERGRSLGRVSLRVPGRHNIGNALAAAAAARVLGVSADRILEGLTSFSGTDRRFQLKGKRNGFTIVDDYAHHPTEIAATLHTAAGTQHRSVWCIFQPHTYTRTKALLSEFADALSLADHVVLADIYAAREKDIYGISSRDLQREIALRGTACEYFPSFAEIEAFILQNAEPGDLVITMGAGNIYQVGEALLQQGCE